MMELVNKLVHRFHNIKKVQVKSSRYSLSIIKLTANDTYCSLGQYTSHPPMFQLPLSLYFDVHLVGAFISCTPAEQTCTVIDNGRGREGLH